MTPLIAAMSKLVDKPEESTWFDIGEVGEEIEIKVDPDRLTHLPFKNIVIVGTINNVRVAVLAKEVEDSSIGPTIVATGFALTPKFRPLPALFAASKDDKKLYLASKDPQTGKLVNTNLKGDNGRLLGFIDVLSKRLDATKAYAADVVESFTNKRRVAKGKRPLYSWRTVVVRPSTRGEGTGTHASPRAHERRGHWRQLKNKRVWVKSHKVGKVSEGIVFHDYKVQDLSKPKAP